MNATTAAEYHARFAAHVAYLVCAYFFDAFDAVTCEHFVIETCTHSDAVEAYRRYEMSGYTMAPAILPLEHSSELAVDLRKHPGYKDLTGLALT